MQLRTNDGHYTSLEQFYADTCTIRHNIYVCFGGKAQKNIRNAFGTVYRRLIVICLLLLLH